MCPLLYPAILGGAGFLMSVVKRKTVVQLGSLEQHYKPSPVGSRGKMLEIFAYSAFWIAQNITLLALRQGILTKAYTINQDFWAFGGLSWGSQTSLQASKWLWIWHWCLCGWVGGGGGVEPPTKFSKRVTIWLVSLLPLSRHPFYFIFTPFAW